MRYVGLDVHRRVVQAAVVDSQGRLLFEGRIEASREELERFARKRLQRDDIVALEATTNTWAVVDLLEPFVGEVVVSNPLRTRAIAEAKIKTDKIDAQVLAQLLRSDYLPRIWQPDAGTRRIRHLTSRRASLVAQRTAVKNRLHAVLHQRLIQPPLDDLFGSRGRAWLEGLELDEPGRRAIDSELRLLADVQREIDDLDRVLARDAHGNPAVKLLMTLPGVDVAIAQGLLAALGDVSRFSDGDHAASYLGLVPSTRQSADHCYHGPITKRGRSHARWMMVQAAQHLGNHPGPLGAFFRKLAHKKNRNVAVVATARKLVVIAWHMLCRNEPYRYALPRSTQTKLARLRVRATGRRRIGGTPKGSPRPAAYGTGRGSRSIPSIDHVYASEDLPERKPLAPGEARILRDTRTDDFVDNLARTHRVRRPGTPDPKKTVRSRRDH